MAKIDFVEEIDFVEDKPENKKIDLTPSGLINNISGAAASAIMAPYTAIKEGVNPIEATKRNWEKVQEAQKTNPHPYMDAATDLAGYMLLPQANLFKGAGLLAKVGNSALTGGYQGALTGGLESLKNKGDLSGAGSGAGIGAGTNIGIPLAFKGANKVLQILPKTGGFIAKTVGRIKPETLEQVVKPNSKALDLTEDETQQLLLDTTQKVRADYADLLKRKGDDVGELLEKLPQNVQFKASDLSNDLDNILTSYSTSGNAEVNPAVNAFKKLRPQIDDLLFGNQGERVGKFADAIDDLKFPKETKEVFRYGANGHYGTKSASPLNDALVQADRDFNTFILNRIKADAIEDPTLLSKNTYVDYMENQLGKVLDNVPSEATAPYYEKFYQAIDNANMLNKQNMTRNPLELYDINKNISGLTNWGAKTDSEKLSNEILRRLYGAYSDRISSLSPELQKANNIYANLMKFKENDAVNQVLRGDLLNEGVIGAAPTALKNYKANVTSGNKAKNIQDLETMLYKEGYGTFTDKLDDINAARDLLNLDVTGDSIKANVTKALARPALKAVRKMNQLGVPQAIQKIKVPLQRLLPPASVMMTSPMLYGGVEYNDYRD